MCWRVYVLRETSCISARPSAGVKKWSQPTSTKDKVECKEMRPCDATCRGPSARGVKNIFVMKTRTKWRDESTPRDLSIGGGLMFHLSLPEPLHASAVTPSDTIQYCTSIMPSAIAIPGQQNRSTPHAAAVRRSHSCSAADCGRSSTRLHTLPLTCKGTRPHRLTGHQRSGS